MIVWRDSRADEQRRALLRRVGRPGLLGVSLGCLIGSGWLLAAFYAARIAGPASILSWVLGGGFVLLLALVHAELGAMYPVAAGTAAFPRYAFGRLVGFASGWLSWVNAVAIAPIEVEAALQYLSAGTHAFARVDEHQNVILAFPTGYFLAALLMGLFVTINLLGVRPLSRLNVALMVFKVAVPAIAAVAIISVSRSGANFTAHGGFAPYGGLAVISALANGGVIFAFQGFEQAVVLGAESKRPERDILVAVLGAIAIATVIYLLLQVAFTTSLSPADLAHGWRQVNVDLEFGPFVTIAAASGLGLVASLLSLDAVISPGGTGLIFVGSSARIMVRLARQRDLPYYLGTLDVCRRVPDRASWVAFGAGMLLMIPYPAWQDLVAFVTAATVLTYALQPLALGALRLQVPRELRPYHLPFARVLSPAAFVLANEIVMAAGWRKVLAVAIAIVIGFGVLLLEDRRPWAPRGELRVRASWDARSAIWLWPYLTGLIAVTLLGSFGPLEQHPIVPAPWDLLLMAALSLGIYWWAIGRRLDDERAKQYIFADREAALTGEDDA